MQRMKDAVSAFAACLLFCVCTIAHATQVDEAMDDFMTTYMLAVSPQPANHAREWPDGAGIISGDRQYLRIDDSGTEPGWETRIAHDWQFFDAPTPANHHRVLIIDFARYKDTVAFRYLSNGSQNDLYEPWSSSKIMAFSAALSTLPAPLQQARTQVGDVSLGDMITSIHTYAPTHKVPEDSNALATYFANVAGRDLLTALFHARWLNMSDNNIRFRGSYGPVPFVPTGNTWATATAIQTVTPLAEAEADPGYQPYRCEHCGLTGNKPMTTLAQAEFLKRLVTYQRVPQTRMPGLSAQGVETLLYGREHPGGMMAGISTVVHEAVASAISASAQPAKQILDEATRGQWRIFQKIGWGPSETRGTTEFVILAHVSLPGFQGGREFTLAAQQSVPGNDDANLSKVGKAMLQALSRDIDKLINKNNKATQ